MEVIYIKGTAFSFSISMTILKYIKMTQHLDPNGPPDINVVQYKSYEIFQVQIQESLSLVSS